MKPEQEIHDFWNYDFAIIMIFEIIYNVKYHEFFWNHSVATGMIFEVQFLAIPGITIF